MPQETKQNRPSEVIYQIYPSSFCDSNGDGHGDLKGITSKLDYIQKLGVDAVWISPFFLSPEGKKGDGGYAVTDYRKIDPKYGTMDDFKELLDEAHKRGLRVYNDFVLCHTADEHDWFQKSRKREPDHEDRYVWRDGKIGENGERVPPNNWKSVFGGPAWTFDKERDQYYMHHFNTSQPALNLNNPKVQDAMRDEAKFWLDMGVDGFRLDALPFANHDPHFRDNPVRMNCPDADQWAWQRFEHSMCQPQTIELVEKIRELLDSYPGHRTAVGEVVAGRDGGSQSLLVAKDYVHPETGLHSCYTESLIQFFEYPSAGRLKDMLRESQTFFPDGGLCNNASNHDFPRAASRMTAGAPAEMYGQIARQIMALCVALPGDFCMYQGEELSLPQARIPEDIPHDQIKDIDPRPRDGARTPMPWDSRKKNAEFSTSSTPYLPVPESHSARAVNLQDTESNSMLNETRRLLQERKNNPALNCGAFRLLDTPDPIVAFVRETPDQAILFAFNMSGQSVSFKPQDIVDAATLKKLHIAHESEIIMGAYDYTRRGLRGQEKTPGLAKTAASTAVKSNVPKIWTMDFLITDNVIPHPQAAPLIAKHHVEPTRKYIINEDTHQCIMEHPASQGADHMLGGSTGLTMWTLKKLLGNQVDVGFMGLAANDSQGNLVKRRLEDAGIRPIAGQWPEGIKPETASSHVLKHADGQDSILTYPGTEAEALREIRRRDEKVLERGIAERDIVYLPGSVAEKFGMTALGEIMRARWNKKKELVLALPRHATFGPSDNQVFRNLIASANVVMGSDDEFCHLYEMPTKRPIADTSLAIIIAKIQASFDENVLTNNDRPCPKEQVAFITRGDKPAILVTAHKATEIPAIKIEGLKNHLGAGDAAFAGFLAGYLKGLDHEQSATLAMELAAKKVSQDSTLSHLEDPRKSLNTILRSKHMRAIARDFDGRSAIAL